MPQNSDEWKEKDIPKQSDSKIDQDFPGFPHGTASKEIIKPETEEEKKIAALKSKDGEKNNNINKEDNKTDEALSIGSGGAFDSTEKMEDDDNNKREGK